MDNDEGFNEALGSRSCWCNSTSPSAAGCCWLSA